MKKTYCLMVVTTLICALVFLFVACNSKNKGNLDAETQESSTENVTVTEIAISANPYTTEFLEGERFDAKGLILSVTYANGKKETVSEGFTCTVDAFTKSGYYPVTVEYAGKTLTYTVTVASSGLLFEMMEGECVLRGIGDCRDTDIIIPSKNKGETVTIIGGYAFEGNETIKSVKVPEGVICIADYAFAKCTKLERVELPNSLEVLTGSCFRECSALTKVNLPIYLNRIGSSTFALCEKLSEITIPHSVLTLGKNVFADCEALTVIHCQADSRPDGWDDDWNGSHGNVMWGVKE